MLRISIAKHICTWVWSKSTQVKCPRVIFSHNYANCSNQSQFTKVLRWAIFISAIHNKHIWTNIKNLNENYKTKYLTLFSASYFLKINDTQKRTKKYLQSLRLPMCKKKRQSQDYIRMTLIRTDLKIANYGTAVTVVASFCSKKVDLK